MSIDKASIRSLFVFSLAVVFFSACSDLRTTTAKKDPQPEKAKQLLVAMGKAHGIENWKNISTYTADFEDEFYGKLGERSTPFGDPKATLKLQYIPASFDGRLIQFSGPNKGKVWGIQSWETYTTKVNSPEETGHPEFAKHKDATFWVPTYQYFIEFPLRIQEATALAYAGEREIDGTICEGILASWKTVKPQKKTDQYLIWIDKETKRIKRLEYTVRDIVSFITGAANLKDYTNYNGILLPAVMSVESNLVKEGLLHEMRILNFEPNTVPVSLLRPDNTLNINGDQKN